MKRKKDPNYLVFENMPICNIFLHSTNPFHAASCNGVHEVIWFLLQSNHKNFSSQINIQKKKLL